MDRKDLEALSTAELQKLITDAAWVLAARCEAAAAAPSTSPSASPSLFSFSGSAGGSSSSGGTSLFGGSSSGGSGLFGPPARTGESSSSLFSFGSTTAPAASTSGAGKLFGGTGGGLFGGAVAFGNSTAGSTPPTAVQATGAAIASALGGADDDEDDDNVQEEVVVVHGWTPSVSLEVLDSVATGEEEEEQLWSQRSKLYRFREDEWKERGLGEAKLLKNKANGRIRFLLRQEKTLKVVANHFVVDHDPYCDLRPNSDSQKILCWCAQDWSEGEMAVERFALKFGTEDFAKKFHEAFNDAKVQNSAVMAEQLKKK